MANKARPDPNIDAQPWEQQHGEPDAAYAAFQVYRDLSPDQRSQAAAISEAASRGLRLKPQVVRNWSARWRWAERMRAWNVELDRMRQRKMIEEANRMDERIARASAMQEFSLTLPSMAIQRKIQRAQDLGIDVVGEMSEADIAPLIGMAVAAARVYPGIAQTEQATRRAALNPSLLDGDLPPSLVEAVDEPSELDRVAAMFAFMEEEGIERPRLSEPPRKQLSNGGNGAPQAGTRRVQKKPRGDAPPHPG